MIRTLRSLALLAVVLLALVAGCGKHTKLYAPTTNFPSGVQVYLMDADINGERLYVKMKMMNLTKDMIHIDRDGMSLRLPNGLVLPRSVGKTSLHNRYDVAPGQGHDVFVDFRAADDMTMLSSATVILGGVSFGTDPMPHIAGELPLSNVYVQTPMTEAPPAATAPAEAQPAPAPTSAPPVQGGKDI